MKKEKAPIKEIKETTPDIYHLGSLSKEALLAIIRLGESTDGKIFLTLLDEYIKSRMAEVYYNRDTNSENRLANDNFDQGRGSCAAEIKFLFKNAHRELEKREV